MQARRRIAIVGLMAWVATAAAPVHGAVFTVTTNAAAGPGSLRQAIDDANASEGIDTIAFAIPEPQCSASGVCTIHLGTSPAALTGPVIVDGTTQPRYGTAPENVCATADAPSYLRVEITVPDIDDYVFQLDSAAGPTASTFRGVALAGGRSLRIYAAGAHRVQCNHLGVNGPGTALLDTVPHLWNPPTVDGVIIEGSGQGVIVGTDGDGVDDVSERNVMGAGGTGVNVNANSNNVIAGNFIGLGADGVTPLGETLGIFMRQSSGANRVGTDFDGVSDELERNVIGNCYSGVGLYEYGSANAIVGNWIGVDANGAPAANVRGIFLSDSGAGRLIDYNRIESNTTGIEIDAGSAGTLDPDSRGNCFAANGTGFAHGGTAAIAFESNWWGAADGPSGTGPGSGDAVTVSGSGSIDFTPWETNGCPAPEPGELAAASVAGAALAFVSRAERRRRTLRNRAPDGAASGPRACGRGCGAHPEELT